MEGTWLNPEFATQQIILIGLVFLIALIVLPVVFGVMIYTGLGLLARLMDQWRTARSDYSDSE